MTTPRPIRRAVKGPAKAEAPITATGGEDLSAMIAAIECEIEALGLAKLEVGPGRRRWVLAPGPTLRVYMASAVEQADGAAALSELKAEAARSGNPYQAFRWGMSTQALQNLLRLLEDHGDRGS